MDKLEKKRNRGKQSQEVSKRTKETVLKAALKVFAREGFYNAKLREMADLAGTTHSLIRHHFGSKYDLYKAVVDYGLNVHEVRLRRVAKLHKSDNSVELLKNFIASYVSLAAKNPEFTKIKMHNNTHTTPLFDYIMERQKQLHVIVEPVFKKVQKCGYFEEFDHDSFFVYLHALVETPIVMMDMANELLGQNLLSKKGIAMHTERVLNFLFPR